MWYIELLACLSLACLGVVCQKNICLCTLACLCFAIIWSPQLIILVFEPWAYALPAYALPANALPTYAIPAYALQLPILCLQCPCLYGYCMHGKDTKFCQIFLKLFQSVGEAGYAIHIFTKFWKQPSPLHGHRMKFLTQISVMAPYLLQLLNHRLLCIINYKSSSHHVKNLTYVRIIS